jgi:hypothetical protein
MAYLAHITEWMKSAGPFGIALAFLGSFLAFGIIRYIYEVGALRTGRRRAIEMASSLGKTNVLRDEFKEERINANDFHSVYGAHNDNKIFEKYRQT